MGEGLIKYFKIEDKREKPTYITFSNLLVRLYVDEWEFIAMNRPQDCLYGLDIYENSPGVYCIEGDYKIEEITREEANKIIKEEKREWEGRKLLKWN